MKMTKRIFIALLIVALTVSSIAVFASAEETTLADYVNVLEYFEEQSLIDFDFGGEDVDYSATLKFNRPSGRANQFVEELVADASSPAGKYLSVAVKERSGRTAYGDNHVYFTWTSDEAIDDFNIDMTVSGAKYNSGSENDENLPKIVIVVNDTAFADMNKQNLEKTGTTIASIDYRGGYFTYLKANGEFKTDYKIEEGQWYNVSLTYDVDNGVSITVYNCADPANAITVTDGYVPFESVKDVRVGAHGDDNGSARGSTIKFADVRVLGGVYHRESSNMQADVEAKVIGMYDLFNAEDATIEDKIAVCTVAEKLVFYGFTSENAQVNEALAVLGKGAVGLYNNKIEEFVATVDTLDTFDAKKAYLEEVIYYAESLASMDLSNADAETVATTEKNLSDFESVHNRILASEADSAQFLALVESVREHSLTDYNVIKADLALFEGCEPDLTYEGVAEAYKHYNKIVRAESDIRLSSEEFIAAVNVANDTTLDFNTRAVAYSSIEGVLENDTYPGVAEANAIYVEVLVPFMHLEISNAENFVKYVKKADYALYISAKQENLDIAKTYMDICQPEFEGVAEAKVLYEQVQLYINQKLADATAYINAVNALDSLTGSALTAAIKNAESLQEAGNVLGVDGVTEANIKLNQIIASIELREKYCVYFLNLVAALDKADDATETFEILADAREAEAMADKSYAGVADASAKLAKAIADFNAQVEAINAEFEKANDVAANTCGVGGNAKTVSAHVVALVKKFFDEE
jgi:hypothetical protein